MKRSPKNAIPESNRTFKVEIEVLGGDHINDVADLMVQVARELRCRVTATFLSRRKHVLVATPKTKARTIVREFSLADRRK